MRRERRFSEMKLTVPAGDRIWGDFVYLLLFNQRNSFKNIMIGLFKMLKVYLGGALHSACISCSLFFMSLFSSINSSTTLLFSSAR